MEPKVSLGSLQDFVNEQLERIDIDNYLSALTRIAAAYHDEVAIRDELKRLGISAHIGEGCLIFDTQEDMNLYKVSASQEWNGLKLLVNNRYA